MAIQYLNKTISEDVTFINTPSVSIGILYQMLDLIIFQINYLVTMFIPYVSPCRLHPCVSSSTRLSIYGKLVVHPRLILYLQIFRSAFTSF